MKELHNRGKFIPWNMHHTSFDHPPVEVLERFALHTCSDEEVEMIETHILACDSCVGALENVEVDIAATKLALADLAVPQRMTIEHRQPDWRGWLSFPTFSWAGAALAACALCVFVFVPVNVNVAAERGSEKVSVAPEWRKFNLNLAGENLPAGKLRAEIVNETGASVWSGHANNSGGQLRVEGLRMTQAGHFLARIYAPDTNEELSEYSFDVKFKF